MRAKQSQDKKEKEKNAEISVLIFMAKGSD